LEADRQFEELEYNELLAEKAEPDLWIEREKPAHKKYMTEDQAWAASRRLWSTLQLKPYKCCYCHGWHVAKHKPKRMEFLFSQVEQQLGIA
jgi:hypothetical protein